MSGPKVINIEATRELERKRLAAHAAALRAALARLEGATAGLPAHIAGQVPSHIEEQLAALEDKAAASGDVVQIMALRDQARSLHSFIRSEKRRILQTAEEWRAAENANLQSLDSWISHLRRQAEGNDSLLAELSEIEAGDSSFSEKAARLEAISHRLSNRDTNETEEIGSIRQLAEEWRELVARGEVHTSELPTLPMARWRVEVERLRQHLDAHPDMAARIAEVEAEKDEERRRMLLDGLRYDAADWLARERTRNEQADQTAEWRESLIALGMETVEVEDRLAEAETFEAAKQWAERTIEALARAEASAFARRAILDSLGELGYEVREGMETAWVENGRIVLSKPNDPLYGVEISQMPRSGDDDTVKTRVVRRGGQPAAAANEKQRDREQEENWCSDREALEKELAKSGVELQIKAARQPGSVPVAVVESDAGQDRGVQTGNNRTREK